MALEQLGVPDEDMMILSVWAKDLRVGHAILLVFVGNDGYVLDILTKAVMKQALVKSSYLPLIGVNTKFWMYLHNVT